MADHSHNKQGKEVSGWQASALPAMSPRSFINTDAMFRSVNNRNCSSCVLTALVIEELKEAVRYPLSFCRLAKHDGVLGESRRGVIKKVHIIMPSAIQIYHVSGLERCCHYTIRIDDISKFLSICGDLDLEMEVYPSYVAVRETDFITIRNNMFHLTKVMQDIYNAMPKVTSLLKKRNSNFSITYGYSGRNRSKGGPPVLTTGIGDVDSVTLLPLLLHILCELTEDRKQCVGMEQPVDKVRLRNFSQCMGDNFGYILKRENIFEGVDCAIRIIDEHPDSLLSAHCDEMNDWRPGSNFCSVVKAIVDDRIRNSKVNLTIVAYSRKVIGDYLYGPGNYPVNA